MKLYSISIAKMSNNQVKPQKPITIKKPMIINSKFSLQSNILKKFKVLKPITCKEDVIYTSKPCDFFSGEFRRVQIVNRLNSSTNSCRTIASCVTTNGEVYEKNSDEITAIIGQNNYDVLFSSMCSVFSQELKIRGIWSLLTRPKLKVVKQVQTEPLKEPILNKICKGVEVQTLETYDCGLKKVVPKRQRKSRITPYVLTNTPEIKRIVIPPTSFSNILKSESEVIKIEPQTLKVEPQILKSEPQVLKIEQHVTDFPDLGPVLQLIDEDSISDVRSNFSVPTIPDLDTNPLNIIEQHTRSIKEEMGTEVYNIHDLEQNNVCYPRITNVTSVCNNDVPSRERMKIIIREGLQAIKNCLERDQDGFLPIHLAVLNNDVEALNRQCLALKRRDASVEIVADGQTPLKMALYKDNITLTTVLLDHGADVLDTDDEERTPLHTAATLDTEHLETIVNYCRKNAKKVLENNEELWKPEFEHKSDVELCDFLLEHISKLPDHQGLTPLMLASKLGIHKNVRVLCECCRSGVQRRAAGSGNSALYEAVRAACIDCADRGNTSKVADNFYETVKILVENGADPGLENFSGSSVNDVLQEYNIRDLSMLVANVVSSNRCKNTPKPPKIHNKAPSIQNASKIMLFKDSDGKVITQNINAKQKPQILANIPVIFTPTVNLTPNNTVTKINTTNNSQNFIIIQNFNSDINSSNVIKNETMKKPIILKKAVKRKSSTTNVESKKKAPNT